MQLPTEPQQQSTSPEEQKVPSVTTISQKPIQAPSKQQSARQLYPSQFTTKGLPNIIAKKLQGLVQILNKPVINITKVKKYLAEGIPDEAAVIREYCWKIILGYLPQQKKLWKDRILKQEKTYFEFVKLFLPEEKFEDYPIVLKKTHPQYSSLSEDFNIWQQIQKDTSRTHAELSFFCTPAPNIMIPFLTSPRRQKFRLIYGEDEQKYKQFINDKEKQRKSYRYDYMSRILFVYAKLNPRILYVQGMNEILAPIFYLANSGKQGTVEEAACFFMFNNAISDVIELHIKDLDKSENGIYGKLNEVNEMLMIIEPQIWSRLELLKIDPFFYCFRWMTLLFAQDFMLFDTLRIWQSIFSSDNRLTFMNYLAISMIISAKEVIMKHDFTYILNHLQSVSQHININNAIKIAIELQQEFQDVNFTQHAKKAKKIIEKNEKKKLQKKQQKEKEKQSGKVSIGNAISGKVNNFIGKLNKFLD